MKQYHIERQVGEVKLAKHNLFVDNIESMEDLEAWEARLENLGEPFLICFKENRKGKIVYSIFVNERRKGGVFRT